MLCAAEKPLKNISEDHTLERGLGVDSELDLLYEFMLSSCVTLAVHGLAVHEWSLSCSSIH